MRHQIIKFIFNLFLIVLALALVIYGSIWLCSLQKYNVSFGVSFSPDYATSLGLDWKTTYQAILTDLKPKYIRLSAPWNEVEKKSGQFNYQDLDYMMNEAGKNRTKVLLVVGQKVPRWPECYFPNWLAASNTSDRKQALLAYETKTVERYKNDPTLEAWQVENEPFINFDFGSCAGFDPSAVKDEIDLVHRLDPSRKIVVTDSGELSTWYTAAHNADILGVTLYRIVKTPDNFTWKYSYLPAGTYKLRARFFGFGYDKFYISELQAEPWFNGGTPLNTDVSIQEQTMNPDILNSNISYTEAVGASRAYFWGAEWWYFMKTEKHDSRYWDIAKQVM